MALSSRVSAFIESTSGNVLNVNRSASVSDNSFDQIFHNPLESTVLALSSKSFDLCDVTDGRYLFIETSQPVDVTFTTPLGITPTPTAATIRVANVLLLTSDSITDLSFFNPNNTDLTVKITVIGL